MGEILIASYSEILNEFSITKPTIFKCNSKANIIRQLSTFADLKIYNIELWNSDEKSILKFLYCIFGVTVTFAIGKMSIYMKIYVVSGYKKDETGCFGRTEMRGTTLPKK